jgi:uncharacterized iron-regulated membrane protein
MQIGTYISSLRRLRSWHRMAGITLAALLLISALTGIFLAFKKEVDFLQPPVRLGQSESLNSWMPLDHLAFKAEQHLKEMRPETSNAQIDRIDVRPEKGIAKILFDQGYWEVQIHGTSGEVLSVARRHSDWIEAIHDGSIISDTFKLISMNFLGFGLIALITSGLWLWYGPRKIRALKKRQ